MTREEKIVVAIKLTWFIVKKVFIIVSVITLLFVGIVYHPVLRMIKDVLSLETERKSSHESHE